MINIFKIKNKPFSLVKDAGYNNKHPFYDLAKDYDNYGFIDKKLGMELYNLFEEGYTIGIHRTGYSKIGSVTEHDIPDILKDIFHNGLKNMVIVCKVLYLIQIIFLQPIQLRFLRIFLFF